MPDSFDKTAPLGEQFALASAGDRAWRQEVASRLDRYRVRRKRSVHEPSLTLNFDPVAPVAAASAELARGERSRKREHHVPSALRNLPQEPGPAEEECDQEQVVCGPLDAEADVQSAGTESKDDKVLQFPRSALYPVFCEELAEPVQLKPRILDVPEQFELAAAPIMDIGLAPVHDVRADASEFELPLPVASTGRRAAAGVIDFAIVLGGAALFLGLMARWGIEVGASNLGIGMAAGITALFWFGFEYLFLAHGEETPGAQVARLELAALNGEHVARGDRRWRAWGMAISYLPLGLGVAWALFDEDGLCWHDRISRTYLRTDAPAGKDEEFSDSAA